MPKQFRSDKSGATAIEYALIAALIVVILITSTRALQKNIAAHQHKMPPTASAPAKN